MQKFIYFLLFLVSAYAAFGQNHSGTIIYKVETPETFEESTDTSQIKYDMVKDIFKKRFMDFKKSAPFITHQVDFNTEMAIGTSTIGMANDNGLDLNDALATVYAIGTYAFDFTQKRSIHQFKDMGKTIRVYRSTDSIEWELKNEFKTINGYKCQKAVAQYSFNYLVDNEITAWFTPELSIHIGPIGIAGLPGAILRLEKQNFSYYASAIKLKNNTTLELPQKGELMSAHTYQQRIIENNPRTKELLEQRKQ